MKKATLSIYISVVLLLLLLLVGSSLCFSQSGGGSVQDTTLTLITLSKPIGSGGGSVPDTSLNYVAIVKSYDVDYYPNKKSDKKSSTKRKNEVVYYGIKCNDCCFLQKSSYSKGAKVTLPPYAKITDPKIRIKLQEMLKKKMSLAADALK